jgi:integrase
MRLGEAIRLDRTDLDAAEGIVTIRDSKFAKSRQIPLHPSTLDALAEYGQLRDQRFPDPRTPSLLVSTAGTRLISQNIHYVFARLVRQAGLQPRSQACRPCPHGFRHSLAVNTLLEFLSAVAVSTVSGVSYAQGCGHCRNVAPSVG